VKKKALILALSIPIMIVILLSFVMQGAAKIPLTVNFSIGEKMIYYTSQVQTIQSIPTSLEQLAFPSEPNTIYINFTEVVEVVDFDGETYFLNQTQTMIGPGPVISFSFLEKMHKTGYSTYIFSQTPNIIASNTTGTTNPVLIGLLEKEEVTVGDTWIVPVNASNSQGTTTGTLTLTFKGIQEITVPAGTYKVFVINSQSNNSVTKLNFSRSNQTTVSSTMNMNLTGQTYIEYDTGREISRKMHIKSNTETTITTTPTSKTENTTQTTNQFITDITIHTQLAKHLEPAQNSTLTDPLPFASSNEQAAIIFLKEIVELDTNQK